MTIEEFDALDYQNKLKVCWDINSFPTLNGISKRTLHHIFKWLVEETIEEK